MAKNNALNLTIKVNDKQADNTIKELNSQFYRLRNSVNKVKEGTDEWKEAQEELAVVERARKQAIENQRKYREELYKTIDAEEENTEAITEFSQSASNAFSSLMSGDLLGFQEGMKGVAGGIKGATKAAWGFIATPIGAAIAGLAGIALAAKYWFSYNEAVVESLRLTQQITGLSDQAADQARIRAEVITETFGGEFKSNLEAARNLAIQFGISYSEAFDMIEGQLVRGQKNNDEFFSSLNEYSVFFAQAKFSAEEFGRIIATGYDLEFYNDKLPDALKEADISLKEQTTATRDALVNAFGATFTDDILSRIKNGETSTKDALQEISAEADKSNINLQQNAQLTADLFRGAGEDAGGALKVMEALNTALNDQQRPLRESEKILEEQVKTTTQLKEVSSALFATGDEGFGLLIDKAKLFGTKVLVDILHKGVDLINWFIELNNKSSIFSGYLSLMGTMATASFEILDTLITAAGRKLSGLGDIISGVFTLDTDEIMKGFIKTTVASDKMFRELKQKALDAKDDISNAFSGNNQMEKITIGEIATDSTNDENIDAEAEKRIEQEKEVRRRVESALNEWEAEKREGNEVDPFQKAKEIAQKELDYFEQQEGKKTAIKREQGQQRTALEEYFASQEKKIQDKKVEWNKLSEQQKLQAVTGGLAAAAEAFNEGSAAWKAAKIAETTVATYQGAQNAFTSLSAIPVVGPALGAAAAGAAIVAGLKRVSSIASTQTPEVPKPRRTASFAKGGYTDPFGLGYRDESGEEVAGVVHTGEYVIPKVVRKDPEVPQIIDYLEQKRKKLIKGYNEGGDVDSNPSGTDNSLSNLNYTNTSRLESLMEVLIEICSENRDIIFSDEAELKRQERQKKLDRLKNKSKIKN